MEELKVKAERKGKLLPNVEHRGRGRAIDLLVRKGIGDLEIIVIYLLQDWS